MLNATHPKMIEVEHLTKDYGTVIAVRNLSFTVGKGEVVGFLGPNGAGKSTTLRMLAGFLGATSGSIRIAGHDIQLDPIKARRSIGYMPEAAPLYPEMRVREYLAFRAELKGVASKQRKDAVARAMAATSTLEMSETLIEHLSKGYRQRVGLADALVSNPPLLILDEPTAGLDPNQIREVRSLIRRLGEEHTILLSTHILSEVETACDRAIVINRGRLVAEGTIDALRSQRRADAAQLIVRDTEGRAASILEGLTGVQSVTVTPVDERGVEVAQSDLRRIVLTYVEGTLRDSNAPLEDVARALAEHGVQLRELVPEKASLEDVFVQLTAAEAADRHVGARP